jgi:DNA invertase Pin-like site-specific DNA recombinase
MPREDGVRELRFQEAYVMATGTRRRTVYVDGYVRVSRVGARRGERFISPVVQEELIRAWTSARGMPLLEVFVELDESGRRRDRPLLERALCRVEDGVSDGIVVARLDRFGRSLSDGLAAIDRITRAGESFFAAQDGLDASTDSGRLVLRILFSIAEWDLDQTRESWAEAKARAVKRGTYTGSWLPPGYRKTRAGRLRPDPAVAPLITEAFRRRASGESLWCRTMAAARGRPDGMRESRVDGDDHCARLEQPRLSR